MKKKKFTGIEGKLGRDLLEDLLLKLPEREEKVFRLCYGIGMKRPAFSDREVADIFGVTRERITQIRYKAGKKLAVLAEAYIVPNKEISIEVQNVLSQARELTPYLISHLKHNKDDLRKLPPKIFEYLVAEFFASWGYEEVHLLGNNPYTAADIMAMKKADKSGVKIKYLIEVKRWKDKVGVEVIDRVYGAIVSEREKRGYHVGMIVSLSGFAEFRKYNPQRLEMLGIELRDGQDVKKWLKEYKFNQRGLWLPNP